jgi:hypothetical protein
VNETTLGDLDFAASVHAVESATFPLTLHVLRTPEGTAAAMVDEFFIVDGDAETAPPPAATLEEEVVPAEDVEAVVVDSATTPIQFDPTVSTGQLENGVKYYVKYNRKPLDRAELRIVMKVGSVHEREHERGIAHMIEHLAFRSTKSFDDNFQVIKMLEDYGMRFGADQNALTSFDHTMYELHVPLNVNPNSDDNDNDGDDAPDGFGMLKKCMEVLRSLSFEIRISDEDVDLERTVIEEVTFPASLFLSIPSLLSCTPFLPSLSLSPASSFRNGARAATGKCGLPKRTTRKCSTAACTRTASRLVCCPLFATSKGRPCANFTRSGTAHSTVP